jgi:hypothetical protein
MDWTSMGSVPGKGKMLLIFIASIPAMGPTKPAIEWTPSTYFLEIKRQEREDQHSALSSSVIKIGGAVPALPHTSSCTDD